MVDDKYIGLALAVSSSAAIGTSTVITKKGLTAAADGTSASENLSYLRNPIWWAGMSTLILGEVANFAAYTFAPPVLVTPLGALSVLIGAVLASFLLNERLGHLGRVGCALCLIGSVIIVLHAPDDKKIETIGDFLGYALKPGEHPYILDDLGKRRICGHDSVGIQNDERSRFDDAGGVLRVGLFAQWVSTDGIRVRANPGLGIAETQPGRENRVTYDARPGEQPRPASILSHKSFLLYCLTVCIISVVLAYAVVPKKGRTNPVVYISIASLIGSVSVMFVKGFGVAVKLTFAGKNQFVYPSTYVFGLISAGCIVIQLNYYNKALDTFSVNLVNPMYYVGFCSATIVASLILFEGFNTTDATNTVSLLCGFIVTFLGVHILNLSMLEESAAAIEDARGGVTLEGRLSVDGWHGIRRDSLSMGLPSPRSAHGRRSSLYRAQTSTLFNAFSGGEAGESVGLQRLREEDEEDWDEDADERTSLRTPAARSTIPSHTPTRSLGHSPNPPALGDIRISPRPV
ncbi:magnesium transporter NIPA-domain-containing protein [Mycena capillaripes]|nr:magnesium transporter NIPA-domain-containing protein [Mycena capillaripes]